MKKGRSVSITVVLNRIVREDEDGEEENTWTFVPRI